MAVWSGLFNGVYGENYSFQHTRLGRHDRVLNAFMRRRGNAVVRELMVELLGVAAGATAQVTHTQITHGADHIARGGVRTMETVYDINRATTAADDTALTAMLQTNPAAVAPTDRNGLTIYGRPGG